MTADKAWLELIKANIPDGAPLPTWEVSKNLSVTPFADEGLQTSDPTPVRLERDLLPGAILKGSVDQWRKSTDVACRLGAKSIIYLDHSRHLEAATRAIDNSSAPCTSFFMDSESGEIQVLNNRDRTAPASWIHYMDLGEDPILDLAKMLESLYGSFDSDLHSVIEIFVEADRRFAVQLCKLRAVRILCRLILDKLSATVVVSSIVPVESDDPANLISASVSSVAAASGGSDRIFCEFATPYALTLLQILQEESNLNQHADPAAGSYYFEHFTDQMAESAWSLFQKSIA